MDNKQNRILKDIINKFKLSNNFNFIQHRNLSEFKYFKIEKINPTHRIFVYGKLKNHKNKYNKPKGYIKVGEIIISGLTISLNYNIIVDNINLLCMIFNLFFFYSILIYLLNDINILKEVSYYVNRNRRFFRGWKNCLHG